MLVALYARVSTQEQALNGHSIDEQNERMEKYCDAMGWTVYRCYTDAGFSGANTDRPALQRMIRDIKTGRIDKVLVYKLDRLSRSQRDTLELIEDVFLANGTQFLSMSENFDTATPFGRAMIGILAVFAQLEREQIKERMSMGKLARAKQGKFGGSCQVPIGYDYVDGELVTNHFEKMQIIQIYQLYAAGLSPYAIADKLNAAGMTHKYGSWKESVIRVILTKRTYLGYIRFHGEWYKGTHEPFISEELFNKAQEVMKRKSKEHEAFNRRSGKANSYLGGYLECAHCHAKYSKFTAGKLTEKADYRHEYYICNSRSRKRKELIKDPNCQNKRWPMEELDALIFGEIKKLAVDPEYISKIKDDEPDERPIIKDELHKLNDQLSKLMDLYSVGQFPVELLQDKIHDINDQKTKLERKMELIEEDKRKKLTQEETSMLVQSFGDILDRQNLDEIRAVIGALISKIVIDNEDITIYWNFN